MACWKIEASSLRDCLRALERETSPLQYRSIVQKLLDITNNAAAHALPPCLEEVGPRRLQKTNREFARDVYRWTGAKNFLDLAGWVDCGESLILPTYLDATVPRSILETSLCGTFSCKSEWMCEAHAHQMSNCTSRSISEIGDCSPDTSPSNQPPDTFVNCHQRTERSNSLSITPGSRGKETFMNKRKGSSSTFISATHDEICSRFDASLSLARFLPVVRKQSCSSLTDDIMTSSQSQSASSNADVEESEYWSGGDDELYEETYLTYEVLSPGSDVELFRGARGTTRGSRGSRSRGRGTGTTGTRARGRGRGRGRGSTSKTRAVSSKPRQSTTGG